MARHRDLEISEDYSFQEVEWAVQRLGWFAISVVVLAAMLGLFGGGGPFATATASDPQGQLDVRYERFTRPHSADALVVRLAPVSFTSGEARIWIARDYLEGVQLETVTPEPNAVEAGPDGHTFVFRVVETSQPLTVRFWLTPVESGRRRLQLGLRPGEPLLAVSQFVYP